MCSAKYDDIYVVQIIQVLWNPNIDYACLDFYSVFGVVCKECERKDAVN